MITKTNAVKMSVRKWENIIEDCRNKRVDSIYDDCGFCEWDKELQKGDDCQDCCLLPDLCYHSGILRPNVLYWQIYKLIKAWKFKKALPLAEQMLSEIRTRGKKWINSKK